MRFELDTKSSELIWHASKVAGKHHGHITLADGWVDIDDHGILLGAEASIDMTSITDDDLSNKALNKTLTDHLKSADFFDADNFPVSTIKIVSVHTGANESTVQADLTIRSKTNRVEFPAHISKEGGKWRCRASVTFDRTLWDIKFRSGKFFSGLGDVLIHDEVTLEVNMVTT